MSKIFNFAVVQCFGKTEEKNGQQTQTAGMNTNAGGLSLLADFGEAVGAWQATSHRLTLSKWKSAPHEAHSQP